MASVVASVLVFVFIQPLLSAAAMTFAWAGEHVHSGISKSLYTRAAITYEERFSFITLLAMLSLIAGSSIGALSSRFGRSNAKDTEPSRFRLYVAGLVAFVMTALLFLAISVYYAEIQLKSSFSQQTTILAPHITDQEYKELQAAWASMGSREDFVAISERLDRIAKEQDIVLPRRLWQ